MDLSALALCAATTAVGLFLLTLDATWQRLDSLTRRLTSAVVALLIVAASLSLIALAANNVRGEREWDFLAFWVPATVAADGADFYQPDALATVPLPFAVSDEFRQEVLDGGFSYPPPTMLLVAPFGALDYRAAFWLWYLVQFLGLAISMLLLARWLQRLDRATGFPIDDGRPPVLAALTIVALPSLLTVMNAQTNFWVLVCCIILIDTEEPDSWRKGVALALGVLLKPFVAVLFLPVLVFQNWKTLTSGGLLLIGTSFLSMVIWGQDIFQQYADRTARFPTYLYGDAQPTNQSWAALGTRHLWGGDDPLSEPLFWLGVALFLGIAVALVLRQRIVEGKPSTALWLLVLLTGLLIYPATLKHYFVLLVPAMIYLWRSEHRLGLPRPLLFALLTLALILTSIARGNASFGALALLWATFLYLTPLDHRPDPSPQPAPSRSHR